MTDFSKCRLCASSKIKQLIDFGDQPIVHHLLRSNTDSYATYPFALGVCENCGFLHLLHPISPKILYQNYFTVSAWKHQPHVARLLEVMQALTAFDRESAVLEIGCNDGCFLDELKNYGLSALTGIEPSLDAFTLAKNKGHNVRHEFFNSNTVEHLPKRQFDIVVTRHVLEHILNLEDFMRSVHKVLADNGTFVIEIPDMDLMLETLDYSLWEEHVNYFTFATAQQLLNRFGFTVFHHETTLFSGKAQTIFAKKADVTSDHSFNAQEQLKIFRYAEKWPLLKELVQAKLSKYDSVFIYGCGCRSSVFANIMNIPNQAGFIDDQPEKQGLFVPGCQLPILAWDDTMADTFILLGVNAENENKVIGRRRFKANQFASILPPSRFLPSWWSHL